MKLCTSYGDAFFKNLSSDNKILIELLIPKIEKFVFLHNVYLIIKILNIEKQKPQKKYRKVLCREKDDELLTCAFLADQSKYLTRLSEDAESFDDTAKVDEYQTSVAEIQHLTGLNFSNLIDFDTLDNGVKLKQYLESNSIK